MVRISKQYFIGVSSSESISDASIYGVFKIKRMIEQLNLINSFWSKCMDLHLNLKLPTLSVLWFFKKLNLDPKCHIAGEKIVDQISHQRHKSVRAFKIKKFSSF